MIELRVGKFEEIQGLDKKIDLIIADPPDNIGKEYAEYEDKLQLQKYLELLDLWLRRCCQLTDGPVFFTFNEKWIPAVEHTIVDAELKLVQRCWWYYTFGQHNATRYTPCVRPIYWLNNDTIYPDAIKIPSARQEKYHDKRAKGGGRMPPNVWEFSRICGTFKERRKWHVVQLPEALVERIILGHSQEGNTVLDPFSGSGTSIYAAAKLKRHAIGLDISPFYIQKTKEELEKRGLI